MLGAVVARGMLSLECGCCCGVVESVVGVGEVGVVGERGGPSFSRPFSPSLGLRRE